uniref:Diphthamide biosynthesis protein 3 n=1 Tax=Falco tinnunculus TaxID=100819 RepID=A0A8C4UX94_FALTI
GSLLSSLTIKARQFIRPPHPATRWPGVKYRFRSTAAPLLLLNPTPVPEGRALRWVRRAARASRQAGRQQAAAPRARTQAATTPLRARRPPQEPPPNHAVPSPGARRGVKQPGGCRPCRPRHGPREGRDRVAAAPGPVPAAPGVAQGAQLGRIGRAEARRAPHSRAQREGRGSVGPPAPAAPSPLPSGPRRPYPAPHHVTRAALAPPPPRQAARAPVRPFRLVPPPLPGAMSVFHDEVEIEDFEYDEETETYSYPCPCGDRFLITREDLENGEDVATCPSCSLILRVIYDQLFPSLL